MTIKTDIYLIETDISISCQFLDDDFFTKDRVSFEVIKDVGLNESIKVLDTCITVDELIQLSEELNKTVNILKAFASRKSITNETI